MATLSSPGRAGGVPADFRPRQSFQALEPGTQNAGGGLVWPPASGVALVESLCFCQPGLEFAVL